MKQKTTDLTDYLTLTNWINLNPYVHTDFKALADRYHWHLQQAGLSLKEHNLLPTCAPAIVPQTRFPQNRDLSRPCPLSL